MTPAEHRAEAERLHPIARWFRDFWYHDTIDEMQRKMLRYVWRWRARNRREIIERLSTPVYGYRCYLDHSMPYPITLGACRNVEPYIISLVADDTYPIGETQ